MQEITDWLTRLGLPEYVGAFAKNGIDVSVLPHLTDQDLKDIGVLLGRHRHQLTCRLIQGCKALGVLGHAELFEPVGNLVHRGAPRGSIVAYAELHQTRQ
jgi:hypothetical protein